MHKFDPQTKIYTMKMVLRSSVLFVVILFCSCSGKVPQKSKDYPKIENSILLVYTSGTPFKTLSDIKPEEVDAVSGATPADVNVKTISQLLVKKLRTGNYTVHIAKASEINDYRELLQYNMLIIGTPTYFWNMNWEIKKMMDECFEKIYLSRRDDFKKMKHIVFAMSEYDKCAENAIKQVESGITDCSAKLDASMVFVTKETMPQYEAQIEKLAAVADSLMHLK
jgi:hypothetical protein